MNHYRFSFSWSRILPDGTLASVNEAGIDYYNRLIDSILAAGIEPIATIFHFDVPQAIQNLGGFTNEIVVDYFTDYANLLFSRFGERVKMWITINEPSIFCGGFHGGLLHPVLPSVDGVGEYLCGHNALKAHASAYRLYKREYSSRFGGQVGIALYCKYFYSNTNNTDDVKRALDFEVTNIESPHHRLSRENVDFCRLVGSQIQFSVQPVTIRPPCDNKSMQIVSELVFSDPDCHNSRPNGYRKFVALLISSV